MVIKVISLSKLVINYIDKIVFITSFPISLMEIFESISPSKQATAIRVTITSVHAVQSLQAIIFGQNIMRESAKPPVRGKTSPYGFFVKMCYEEHKKKYPNENVQVTEISRKCSEKWKTMSDDEKRRFFELAQKDAERYQAEVAAYGGEDALRKRKRVKKDPNAPKRALSAFFFFSHDKRPEVQQQHPEWKVGQVAQELGRFWKALGEEERAVYERKALEDKERYAEEMRNYKGTPVQTITPMKMPMMTTVEGVPASGMMQMGVPPHAQQMVQAQDVNDEGPEE